MTTPSLSRNFLTVALSDFRTAMKVFAKGKVRLGRALLSFENGFLSIVAGKVSTVMRAEGDWRGRATFFPEILRALAKEPPTHDPLPIAYAEGYLRIGNVTIPCLLDTENKPFIDDWPSPSLVDLLYLSRTVPPEKLKPSLAKKANVAREVAERRIKKAAALLEDLEVLEEEIRALVELRIAIRLESENE